MKDCMTVTAYQTDKLQLEVDWSKISLSKHITGHISIMYSIMASSVTHNYQIPFTGQLVKGEISYDHKLTQFHIINDDIDDDDQRIFRLKNNFSLPLLVTNITVAEGFTRSFRIVGFSQPILIPIDEERDLFSLALINTTSTSSIVFVHTNVSLYEVPIYSFNGRLHRVVPLEVSQYEKANAVDEAEINFGILPISVSHHALIAFINPNPVPIKVTSFKARTQAGSIWVILRGCGELVTEPVYICDEILPQQWIVFEINVMAPTVGSYTGKFTIKTEINGNAMEEIVTPVKFTTAMGRLELNKDLLHFTDCYPVSI